MKLIPAGHQVRVVNRAVEQIDLEPLLRKYKGGGSSSYHPGMMLKVLVYGYTQRIYSSRQIAKALRENVNFMWLSGGNRPDFRTINEFRGEKMSGVIEEVFTSVLGLLVEEVAVAPYFALAGGLLAWVIARAGGRWAVALAAALALAVIVVHGRPPRTPDAEALYRQKIWPAVAGE